MIDIKNASEVFSRYVKEYDMNNPKILLKVKHTYKTVEVANKIAEDLNLTSEEAVLAQLIALLHDIGRFEQLRIYNTFRDIDSIDHAELGIKILFKDGIIRNFIKETKYDDIIYKAIKNHNKFKIEEGLNKQELLQAKIIRDADKTDIYRVIVQDIEENYNVLYNYNEIAKQNISPYVMEKFENYMQADRNKFSTGIDSYINMVAFIFDYNFIIGLKIIKENSYIEKIMKPVCICDETKEQMEKIIKIANEYINQRIENEENEKGS